MSNLFPGMFQNERISSAVSIEAQYVTRNFQNSHASFIGQSIFASEMYKHQVKKKFEYLSGIWKAETMFSSSISEIVNNSSYRAIINLGEDALPLIIDDLKKTDTHWFYALESITGENPIKKEHRGVIPMMKVDWIEWATQKIE